MYKWQGRKENSLGYLERRSWERQSREGCTDKDKHRVVEGGIGLCERKKVEGMNTWIVVWEKGSVIGQRIKINES